MKLKKQLASLAVVGMMSIAAAASTFAAGVGYVNIDTLLTSHKDYPKVSAQMQAAVKKAEDDFNKQAPNLKTDQERQALYQKLQKSIAEQESKLVIPMENDIIKKIEQVRQEKKLDCIVAEGSVIAGKENTSNQTQAVVDLLKK